MAVTCILILVTMVIQMASSSSWIDGSNLDLDEYQDYDAPSRQSAILLNVLLKGTSPYEFRAAPIAALDSAPSAVDSAPSDSSHHAYARRKKSSVSWLLAAAIRMCQKQPADCLRKKGEFAQLDPSIVTLMQGADQNL